MIKTSNWRYEYKMVVSSLSIEELKMKVSLHPMSFSERYPVRRVNNIYFDTNDLSNYNDSLAGIARRNKLRFRWYGDFCQNVRGVMELKRKEGVFISKTAQAIDFDFDFKKMNWEKIVSILRNKLKSKLNIEFSSACVPVIINNYCRYYYETIDGDYRVTLDCNLETFDQRLHNKPNLYFKAKPQQGVILEVKADKIRGSNIAQITNNFPFRLMQNSKYTQGVII
ncbi:VTC domain-containing protein [Candidatus Omnitrophota bacterium]